MPTVRCTVCGKTIRGSDKWAGKWAKCPNCQSPIRIPGIDPQPKDEVEVVPEPFAPIPLPTRADSSRPVVEHHHKAKGGAFRTGFGLSLGCLLACVVFMFGGCLSLAFLVNLGLPPSSESNADPFSGFDDIDVQPRQRADTSTPLPEASRERAPVPPAASTPSPSRQLLTEFTFSHITAKHDSTLGFLRVLGEVTNNSGKSYTMANFAVTLYDANGEVVDRGYANVSNLANGQTKSFEALFVGVDSNDVAKYAIDFENGI